MDMERVHAEELQSKPRRIEAREEMVEDSMGTVENEVNSRKKREVTKVLPDNTATRHTQSHGLSKSK
jgi:hypothetical protein